VQGEEAVARIIERVRTGKGRIDSLIPRTETLEDIFVDTVKQQ